MNSSADEGLRAPFRQAAVPAPLIIWSGPDCGGAGGRYIRRVRGQSPFQLTGLSRLQHTCGLKIDSPLLCILSLVEHFWFCHRSEQIFVMTFSFVSCLDFEDFLGCLGLTGAQQYLDGTWKDKTAWIRLFYTYNELGFLYQLKGLTLKQFCCEKKGLEAQMVCRPIQRKTEEVMYKEVEYENRWCFTMWN